MPKKIKNVQTDKFDVEFNVEFNTVQEGMQLKWILDSTRCFDKNQIVEVMLDANSKDEHCTGLYIPCKNGWHHMEDFCSIKVHKMELKDALDEKVTVIEGKVVLIGWEKVIN
jgi:hypothetical protein